MKDDKLEQAETTVNKNDNSKQKTASAELWKTEIKKKALNKNTIYLLIFCNSEERIAQNIYIQNSNKNLNKNKNYRKVIVKYL